MKKLPLLVIAAFSIFLLPKVSTVAQNAVIVGPPFLCLGECGVFELVSMDSSITLFVDNWIVNGIPMGFQMNPITLCADQPDGFSVLVFALGSNGTTFVAETFVEVATGENPFIYATVSACPQDSASATSCEKICAFGTGVYEAISSTGTPLSSPVTWQIQGAESYTVNGNSVTVEWGAPGLGQVTATVGGSAWTPPLQVFCGQLNIDVSNPGTGGGGDAYVTAFGGVPPYNFVNPPNLNDLSVGTYTSLVIDAAGNSSNCSFNITNTYQDCWLSANPTEIIHASSCNACDGAISLQPVGGINATFTFQWSTDDTTPHLTGLCPGFYTVTIIDNQNCSAVESFEISCPDITCPGTSTLCVEILEEPVAMVGSQPAAAGGTIEICQGQTVYFENNSINATSYIWDFGDLNTSTHFEPEHSYSTPGSYTVSLIARNACYCSDTTLIKVEVLPSNVPIIDCTGTICEGQTTTYSTDADCSNYNWAITSGVIVDGGGPGDNFVSVEWPQGPEGFVSLEVSGCTGLFCNEPNVVPIPIISDNAQIEGPNKVCEGSTEEYFLPNYDGTEINWMVLGSGNIMSGQGSDRITVNWYGDADISNPQRVIVEFQNCYLGCGGRDTLLVNIVPSFYVEGPIEVCESTTGTYQSRNTINGNPMNSHWEVFNETGATVWSSAVPSNTANIPFTFPPGNYIVHAEPANASSFCNDQYEVFVKLVAAPPLLTGVAGPLEICPGEIYSYEALGLPTSDFLWTITGGAPSIFNGNPANVVWGATPPYVVSAVQVATTGLACASLPFDLNVDPLPSFTINGDGQVCLETQGTYSVPYFEAVEYAWTVSPPGAGTIISGKGSESIEVLWNTVGPATVSVVVCGFTQNFNVNILPLPDPVVQHPAGVCQGETANVQTTVAFADYSWKSSSGTQISTLASPTLGEGHYEVEVTDVNGCKGDTIFEIIEYELPPVSISLPAYEIVCPGGPLVTIYSVITGAGGYTYQWYRDGLPYGSSTADLMTNLAGVYHLIVTDANGCTASSSAKTILDCVAMGGDCVGGSCSFPGGSGCPDCTLCPCGPIGSCVTNGNIDFTFAQAANCDQINFTNTSVDFLPGTLQWNFGDPASGGSNTATVENPSHIFSDVGHYTILLTGQVQDLNNPGSGCYDDIHYNVIVPLKANFEASPACPGSPVSFIDRSIFVTGASITDWSWDFGDPASGAANVSSLQNPMHIYNSPGTYNVTLTLTEVSGCEVSVTRAITVFTPPSVNFDLPTYTCEDIALPFDALVPANTASVYWDFDDPSSGPSNSSSLMQAFHEFSTPGAYSVTLTALSIEGCSNSFSNLVTVTANTLSGNIGYSQPSPICEGDQITLTAPPGGISWTWSSGEGTTDITVVESGVFDVTITDSQGCVYSPPPAPIEVFGEPNGIIKAVQYNEFGQPVAFFENNHTVCAGEDVHLVIQGSLNYSYLWSNGEPGNGISFTNEKGNLLSTGTYNYTVTITDNANGCTSEEGPFTVTVNPVPNVQIASSPSGFLCENTQAMLNVVGPNPAWLYNWNTGETGTGISVIAGGTYFAQAINQFGCKGLSNEITIFNAPDINLIPSGCHSRCSPDTMCLPNDPFIASYQWFLDGVPITGANGTLANPIFTQSGEYSVELTDYYGCSSLSDVLSLDLYPGFGDILGNVYFDVNENGIIDGTDTLVSGIDIFLNDGLVNLDTVTSGSNGEYIFIDILSNNYTVVLDTSNLPPGWQAIFVNGSIALAGCDVEEEFDWLLTNACVPTSISLAFNACDGDGVVYDGTFVPTGTSQDFVHQDGSGCDSIISVTVNPFPNFSSQLVLETCPGTTIDYGGITLAPGDQQDFVLVDQNGCDSIVQVSVVALPTDVEQLQLASCPGSFVLYQGSQLMPGDVQDFIFQNQFGCDSVVTVSVTALSIDTTTASLLVCENETIIYEGVELSPGDQQDFVLTSQNGCDSLVQVSVAGLPTTNGFLQLTACPGSTVTYQGQQLSPGVQQEFTWQNQAGCDSVVMVTVAPSPVDTSSLVLQVCEGETVEYNGQALTAGSEQTVILQNQYGCDSIVQVAVNSHPPISYDLTAEKICWNETSGKIEILNVAGGMAPYLFSLNGNDYTLDTVFQDLSGGTYTVFVQDANDCVFEEQVEILTIPPIFIEADDESLVCGDSVLLAPLAVSELPLNWQWQNGQILDKIWVSSPGTFVFQVTNDCEVVEGSVSVSLEENDPLSLIYMPNSFSPNGDGINDCYKGYLSPNIDVQHFVLKIFDRWGDLMFETQNTEECWNGWFRGKPMDPAVFAWYIEVNAWNCDGSSIVLFKEGGLHLLK